MLKAYRKIKVTLKNRKLKKICPQQQSVIFIALAGEEMQFLVRAPVISHPGLT